MTEDELRQTVEIVYEQAHRCDETESGYYDELTNGACALAAAVERVLDLCDEADVPYGRPPLETSEIRAALYGTTPGTTQETP